MIDDLIVDIKQSESKADEIVHGSLTKAKEIIAQAKSDAEKIAVKGGAEMRALNDEIRKTADAEAQKKYDEIMENAKRASDETQALGEKNKNSAIKMIVDKVLG